MTFIGFSDYNQLNKLPIHQRFNLAIHIKAASGETIRQLCLAGNVLLTSNFNDLEKILEQRKLVWALHWIHRPPNLEKQVKPVFTRHTKLAARYWSLLNL